MRESKLKKKLSDLEGFDSPKASLEQYSTPPGLASKILHLADLRGDIEGKRVADLGAGTGILGYGAYLMGGEVLLVEKDERMKRQLNSLGSSDRLEIRMVDVKDFNEEVDTVLTNPPFGVHSEEYKKFVATGTRISNSAYWIVLGSKSHEFKSEISDTNHRVVDSEKFVIGLPPNHGFHTEDNKNVNVEVYITEAQ